MVKAVEKSHELYVEHLKQEKLKKQQNTIEKQEQVEKKRKLEDLQTEVKRLHGKLQGLKDEEKAALEAIERAMGYVRQGGKKSVVG